MVRSNTKLPVRIVGLMVILMTAGCAVLGHAPPPEAAGQDLEVAVKSTEPRVKQDEGAAEKPLEAQAGKGEAVAVQTEVPQAPPPIAGAPGRSENGSSAPSARSDVSTIRGDTPAAEIPTEARATSTPTDPAPKTTSKASVPEKPPAPPPLDLASLEKRLRETDAIGVFTKLTLKNQVDDLLDRFRAHYEGRNRSSLSELRQPFDLLILKVLSLLQDRDASLANAILASREAMWSILSDPAKFQRLVIQSRG
jgi:hypothetical protein